MEFQVRNVYSHIDVCIWKHTHHLNDVWAILNPQLLTLLFVLYYLFCTFEPSASTHHQFNINHLNHLSTLN